MSTTIMSTTTSTWNGNEMSQNDMMEKDTVLVLDLDDNVIGSASKKGSHDFSTKTPRGTLHRAFSVFLFDETSGDLLLQQRASTKITFPNVWTNTCCSHPLHGMVPPELDGPNDVASGQVMGVKHAAVRKLQHELGIPPEQLPLEKFKFLTRLHYWAADTITHGSESPWGEHEIDYVLFITISDAKTQLTIKPHPDEVDEIQWISKTQLMKEFDDCEKGTTDKLWSPWFRIIVNRWCLTSSGNGWWDNLEETMTTDTFCDYTTIHRFDPPKEHMGGKGNAGPWLDEMNKQNVQKNASLNGGSTSAMGDETKKQGAYGKVKIHKESKVSQILRMDEVWCAIKLLYVHPIRSNIGSNHVKETFNKDDLSFCDDILGKVSRSFAAVIRQLPETLVVDILVFYLVLRALDTIEDDMTAFDSNDVKIKLLLNFHNTALKDPHWSMDGVGEGDEKLLLQQFPKCYSIYQNLSNDARNVIEDITKRMAEGMAEFVDKDMGQGTQNVDEYNRYCHFVAGLVGEGLTRLFVASGLEQPGLSEDLKLSDNMGKFLQKTNIIRDYLEDYVDGRAFWPQTIWKKYSVTGDLGFFKDQPINEEASLQCLNELVTDALELAPDCLTYLAKLQCMEVYRFCAIPQVMAIATLDKCYHNPDVFTGVVKIRKGLSCKLIDNIIAGGSADAGVRHMFYSFAKSIAHKAQPTDPNYERTLAICTKIMTMTTTTTKQEQGKKKDALACPPSSFRSWSSLGAMAFAAAAAGASFVILGNDKHSKSLTPMMRIAGTSMAVIAPSLYMMKRMFRTATSNCSENKQQLMTANDILSAAKDKGGQ